MRYVLATMILVGPVISGLILPTQASAAPPESLKTLHVQKHKAAEEWRKAADKNKDESPEQFYDFYEAEKAVLEAKLELAEDQQRRIDVLKDYIERMQKRFNDVDALYKVNARGGDADRLEQSRFRLLEGKIMLAKAQAKP